MPSLQSHILYNDNSIWFLEQHWKGCRYTHGKQYHERQMLHEIKRFAHREFKILLGSDLAYIKVPPWGQKHNYMTQSCSQTFKCFNGNRKRKFSSGHVLKLEKTFFCKARDYLHDFFPIYSIKGEEFCKKSCLI